MANDVAAAVERPASVGALFVILPGLPRLLDLVGNIVLGGRKAEAGGRLAVVVGNDLACRQHEIVADRGVGVGVVVGGQAVGVGQRVQIRHPTDAAAVVGVLADHDHHVPEGGQGGRCRGGSHARARR